MTQKAFISYRLQGGAETARLIRNELRERGYEVFLDVETIGPGNFDEKLLQEIESAEHFIVVLTPGALDRCGDPADWLRREIAHALKTGRNVVPVLKDDFVFPSQTQLPEDIHDLSRRNAVEYSHQYFPATIEKLVSFLASPEAGWNPAAGEREASRRPNISFGRLPVPGQTELLVGRDGDIELLDAAWQGRRVAIVQVVADGGVGKTCLVWHWLERMRRGSFVGVTQAFDWSFYDHGSSVHAWDSNYFLRRAESHFARYGLALDEYQRKYPDILGEAVGHAFIRAGGLLVLDGVESLQEFPDVGGALKDIGVGSLLRQLRMARPPASAEPRRLAIITTRWPVPELRGDNVLTLSLAALTEDEGARLLREYRDPQASERRLFVPALSDDEAAVGAEFRKTAGECGGHPLALVLLASYLLWRYDGDLLMRREVPSASDAFGEDPGRHVRRLAQTYEQLFASDPDDALQRACRQVLWLIGLFERPAPSSLLKLLKSGAPIDGLTDGLSEELYKLAVGRLQRLRLISTDSPAFTVLETHPLLRDHFRRSLEATLPAAALEAHGRLFERLCESAPATPETLDEAEPLFEAVVHGCKAGRYRDALLDVYCERLQRGDVFYASSYLGAFGQLLSVLSYFLDPAQPCGPVMGDGRGQSFGITGSAYVMNQRSVMLRALNQPESAEAAMTSARDLIACWNDAEKCAADTDNLVRLHIMRGQLSAAEEAIEWYAAFADAVGRGFKLKPDSHHYLRTEVLVSGWRCAVLHQKGKLLKERVLRAKMIQIDRKIFDGDYSPGLDTWAYNAHTPIRRHESDLGEGSQEIETWPRDFERGDVEELLGRLSAWGYSSQGTQRGHLYRHTLQSSRNFILYSLMVARALAAKARREGFILTKEHESYEKIHLHFLINNYSPSGQMTGGNVCQQGPLDYVANAFRTLAVVFYQDLVPFSFLGRAEVCWQLRGLKPELTAEAAARQALSDVGKALDFATRGGWLLYQCDGWLARAIISLERMLEAESVSCEGAAATIREAVTDHARAAEVVCGRHPSQKGEADGYRRMDVKLLYLEVLIARADQLVAAHDGDEKTERDKARAAEGTLLSASNRAEESGHRICPFLWSSPTSRRGT